MQASCVQRGLHTSTMYACDILQSQRQRSLRPGDPADEYLAVARSISACTGMALVSHSIQRRILGADETGGLSPGRLAIGKCGVGMIWNHPSSHGTHTPTE